MIEDMVYNILLGAPNLIGLALWAIASEKRCNRLLDAILSRENCIEDEDN